MINCACCGRKGLCMQDFDDDLNDLRYYHLLNRGEALCDRDIHVLRWGIKRLLDSGFIMTKGEKNE